MWKLILKSVIVLYNIYNNMLPDTASYQDYETIALYSIYLNKNALKFIHKKYVVEHKKTDRHRNILIIKFEISSMQLSLNSLKSKYILIEVSRRDKYN